ncbi:MAG: hypothetical protein ABI885_30105 [Gammaproteobacteria bacterium]
MTTARYQQFNTYLEPEMIDELRELAERTGVPITDHARAAFASYLQGDPHAAKASRALEWLTLLAVRDEALPRILRLAQHWGALAQLDHSQLSPDARLVCDQAIAELAGAFQAAEAWLDGLSKNLGTSTSTGRGAA